MRVDDEKRSCDVGGFHEINPWLFPSPLELANDSGRIGDLLRRLLQEILRDSARCADPWADLASNKFVPPGFHGLFQACTSVLPAMRRMLPTAYGAGMGGILIRRAQETKTP